jgi:peptidoglycan/xylan/chitin deacetylase (PgdA/CDA1 family)
LRLVAWAVAVLVAVGGALALSQGAHGASFGLGFAAIVLLIADRFMRVEGGVPVLVYHSISEHTSWLPWAKEIAVSPASFERHLRTIRWLGCRVLKNSEMIAERMAGKPIYGRPVVLHIDDGYLDNWVAAVPILKKFQMPATIFVSLDFIERGATLRPTFDDVTEGHVDRNQLPWSGYMNWPEIRAVQATGLVDIQPHGIDHGRIETGPEVVDQIRPDNWRRLAWVQWAATQGSKADWHRHEAPPARPYGTPVRRNEAAFAARAWSESEGQESQHAYEARVRDALVRCREVLERELGSYINVFCWPQNRTSPQARRIAYEVGYAATTGGHGENRIGEDPREVSRLHVSDCVLGWRCGWVDSLALAANIRLFQGNYYWYVPLLLIKAVRCVTAPVAKHAVQEAT